jgi:HSP20 family protein
MDFFSYVLDVLDDLDKNPEAYIKKANELASSITGIKNNKDDYTIKVNVPGFEKDELTLEVVNDRLNLDGKHTEFGTVAKSWILPNDVNKDYIDVSLKNGVLTIVIPKMAKPVDSPKKIVIK